jgi:hypothetical protein
LFSDQRGLKVRCDGGECGAQIRTGKLKGTHRDDRNKRSDQTIFNGSDTGLIFDQFIYSTKNSHLNAVTPRSPMHPISIKFSANQYQTIPLTIYIIIKDT